MSVLSRKTACIATLCASFLVSGAHAANTPTASRLTEAEGAGGVPQAPAAPAEPQQAGTAMDTSVVIASPLGEARTEHSAAYLSNGKVLVVGGRGATGPSGALLRSTEVFDPSTGAWNMGGALPLGVCCRPITLLPDPPPYFIQAFGGLGEQGAIKDVHGFEETTGEWSKVGELSRPRYRHTATLLPDGRVLIVGGSDRELVREIELFNTAAGTSAVVGHLSVGREGHTATLLPDGKVMIVGGRGPSGPLGSIERFDLSTGQTTLLGTLGVPRGFHTATLLPDGQVLIAGGESGTGATFPAEVERLNPSSGAVTGGSALRWPRRWHTATLLPDGKVMIAGGDSGAPVAPIEVYDPAANTWQEAGALNLPRSRHTTLALPEGQIMVVGGDDGTSAAGAAELRPRDPATDGQLNLDGVRVRFNEHPPVELVVSPMVELPAAGPRLGAVGNAPRWDIDLRPDAIRINFTDLATYGPGTYLAFDGLDPRVGACGYAGDITGVTATTNQTAPAYNVTSAVTFTAGGVRVQIAPNAAALDWQVGQYIEVKLQTALEPSVVDCAGWQTEVDDLRAEFQATRKRALDFFQVNPDMRFRRGRYAAFRRWETYWRTRISAPGNAAGRYNPALDAVKPLIAAPLCPSPSAVPSNWKPLGPSTRPESTGFTATGMGIVVSLAIDPANANILYAGTNGSGLWKSTNGGASWTSLTDAAQLPGMGVHSIALVPPSTIYIGTGITTHGQGYGVGVLKSTDGGVTWNPTGLSYDPTVDAQEGRVVRRLLVHPTIPTTLFALMNSEILRSTDGGVSWTSQHSTDPSRRFRDIAMHPGNPLILYASTDARNANAMVVRSLDGGTNWSLHLSMAGAQRASVAVTSADPDALNVMYRTGDTDYYIRRHNGSVWMPPQKMSGISYWMGEFEVAPDNKDVMYAGGIDMFKSTDGGKTFSGLNTHTLPSTTFMHDDVRSIVILPQTPSTLFVGNDGGVSKSTDAGATWTDISGAGLDITQFWAGCADPANTRIMGGAQDLGAEFLEVGSNTWKNPQRVGDAYECLIDPANPNTAFFLTNGGYNNVVKSTSKGSSYTWLGGPAGKSLTTRPFVMDPDNRVYIGHQDVFRYTGDPYFLPQWTMLSSFGSAPHMLSPNRELSALGIAQSDPKTMYAGFAWPTWGRDKLNQACTDANGNTILCPLEGKLFRTNNGGAAWVDITAGLTAVTWAGITDLVVHPSNPDRVWVTFGDFWAGQYVYYTPDGGGAWFNQSAGLPDFPVNTIVYQECSDDILYAGTDVGVYIWNKAAGSWECWNTNLPVTIVSDLDIHHPTGKIRAATFGRGMWESPLAPSVNQCSCAAAPKDIAAWWPLDEASGTTARDVVGGYDGTHGTGGAGPSFLAAGKVAGARSFSGAQWIDVPDPADGRLDVGTGEFSLAAWVQQSAGGASVQTIVDKRTSGIRGYALYTLNGELRLQLADGTPPGTGCGGSGPCTNYGSGFTINDGTWHFVAVSVKRSSGAFFYVDGKTAPFAAEQRPGDLGNTGAFRIGRHYENTSSSWTGALDEIAFYRRALSFAELGSTFKAGAAGKCKELAHLPKAVRFCPFTASVEVIVTVCNHSAAAGSYNVTSVTPLPAGAAAGCNTTLPALSTTVLDKDVAIQPGACKPIRVQIAKPAGLTAQSQACYRASVQNTGSANSFAAGATLLGPDPAICGIVDDGWKDLPTAFVFRVSNEGDARRTIPYTISARRAGSGGANDALALDDAAPGQPVSGQLALEPRSSRQVTVQASFRQPDPFGIYDVIMEADLDGDGRSEALASAAGRLALSAPTPTPTGTRPTPTPTGIGPSPTPSRTRTAVPTVPVTPLSRTSTPTPSPDPRFTFHIYAPWVARHADFNVENLTFGPSRDWQPAMSSDGFSFIYVAEDLASGAVQLRLSDITEVSLDMRLDIPRLKAIELPQLTADGATVVFSGQIGDQADWDVYRMQLGEAPENLTNSPTRNERRAALAPDGSRLAFDVEEGGNADIVLRELGTGAERRLTVHPAADKLPSFAPDGQSLVFRSERDGNAEIYRVDIAGISIRRVTNHPAADTYASFAPDGKHILFQSDRDGTSGLFEMDLSGSSIRRLSLQGLAFVTPRYAPDGSFALAADAGGPNYDVVKIGTK